MLRKMRQFIAACTAVLLVAVLMGNVALADDTLRRGDKNDNVQELQSLLNNAGCLSADDITGYYGAATEKAVRLFQSTHSMTVDGVAGSDTINKLRNASKSDKPLKPDSLCFGMEGDKVREIQEQLKKLGLYNEPEITGYYGRKTEAAVKSFQEAAGMKADGIAGAKTREALFSDFKSDSLIPGMKGDSVNKLQQRLKDLGYYTGAVTGLYGQLTEKAVSYFQKLNGLSDDGIAGKLTRTAVFDANARKEKDARRNPTAPSKYKNLPGQTAKGQESAAAIVELTKKYLGYPYVSGAAGPRAFECSGLTYFVYQHFGVTLPRKAREQGYTDYGIKITDRKKLMPGDLVFFNSIRSDSDLCDHVGIYVGNGMMISSPAPGLKVRYGNVMNARDFSWGRRVFK